MHKMLFVTLAGVLLGVLIWRMRPSVDRPRPSERPPAAAASPTPAPRMPRGVERSVPNLKASSSSDIPSDQNHPRYDATKLAGANSLSLATIFYGEIRDPAWAGKREADMKPIVERDLTVTGVKAQMVKTECKHSTCEITFTSSDMRELHQANRAMQYGLLGTVYEPGAFGTKGGVPYFTARIAFDSVERDHQGWEQAYRDRRRDRLAMLRKAGVPAGYPPLPPE
jgi:hypothetical protein